MEKRLRPKIYLGLGGGEVWGTCLEGGEGGWHGGDFWGMG